MKFDNQRNTYRIWLSRLVITIVFTLIILAIVFLPWFDETEFWLTKYHVAIFISAIYIIVNWVNFLKRPYYVSYDDQGEMLVVRFYLVSIFTSRKHSIEIPKQQFVKYELKPFFLGTQHMLILTQNFRGKDAKYPKISLSALEKEDREKMLQSLDKYSGSGTPESQGQ
jgi:hypothetical protein